MARDYQGRAAVVSLNVEQHPGLASRLGVRAIPTLIFFDQKGREAYRHKGVLSRRYIEQIFAKLGVARPGPKK